MKKYLIYLFVSGIVSGILISNFLKISWSIIGSLILINFLVIIILALKKFPQNVRDILIALLIILMSVNLIWLRINQTTQSSQILKFQNQKIEIEGKISGEVDLRAFNTRIVVKVEKIKFENLTIRTNEKIIAVVNHFPKYQTGDRVSLVAKIQKPSNFENNNGIEFDYVSYLAKDKIFSLTYYPQIKLIERPKFNLERSIFGLKEKFLEKVQLVIPSPQAELLGGILLGTKRSLGADLEEKFRIVGLIHIVVLSGYNVTIIAEFVFRILSFLPRFLSASIGAFSIIIFAVMVGSGATVIRSVIMALLALVARISDKNYNVNRALFLAGTIMILHNPQILLHDPSFQLSFVATIGLINLSDLVKKVFKFLPEKFQIKEITSATLSTQIAVLPLLTKMTGELSVVAPIVNIITLQVIPITMLLGFIAGIATFLNQTVGLVLGFIPYLLLSYILKIVEIFSSFSMATVRIGIF